MRRLFNFVLKLLGVVLVFVLVTVAWILFDGLTNLGDKAEVALVLATPESPGAGSNHALLDRAVKLFKDGDFPSIILSGSKTKHELETMTKYLTEKGIPADAILVDEAATTPEAVRKAAEIMKARDATSVMIVTEYYRVTQAKLVFLHEGIASIQKAHVGALDKGDAEAIGREVIALYDYVARSYVLPEVQKIKDEAKVGADKAKVDVEAAKKKVDKSLDGISK
jgi:vancomycin permeability regulator SanA